METLRKATLLTSEKQTICRRSVKCRRRVVRTLCEAGCDSCKHVLRIEPVLLARAMASHQRVEVLHLALCLSAHRELRATRVPGDARLMNRINLPWVRDIGFGPSVVCLHANASTSAQWRTLSERLAPNFRVLAPDGIGAGNAPGWPSDRPASLGDEVAALVPVFEAAGPRFFLVGHSYGAAVALKAALVQPERVCGLALYEPTLFSLLDQESPGHEAANGIRWAVADAARSVAAQNHSAAGERFVDYWMGIGSWHRMPETRRAAIGATMINVNAWGGALFGEPTPLHAFRDLDVPVLYMMGAQSPASSRGVGRLLAQTLPNVSAIEFSELGHMGPVTHAELVNGAIASFLSAHDSRSAH
jgi:pimeloyl-ACP methyl ester carboxylesterase